MRIVELDSRWGDYLDPRWLAELDGTGFLRACRAGTVSAAELRSFVIQQQKYSQHFTRYLCALIANLTEDEDRRELTQNLFEEMGLGGLGNVPHSTLYRQMMAELDIRAEEERAFPETLALVSEMLNACRDENPLVGLAALCLGAEAIVPHVYSQIVHGFEAAGTPLEKLEFFRIHIEGDDEHAVTLRKIIDREVARDPLGLPQLQLTAARLIAARAEFFTAISRNAARIEATAVPAVAEVAYA